MELIRLDYLAYIDEVRRVLASLDGELTSDKARDDVECANRILCMIEAESDYLASNHAFVGQQLRAIEGALAPIIGQPELGGLKGALSEISETMWSDPRHELAARRQAFQNYIPDISALCGGTGGAADAGLSLILAMETAQISAVHDRRKQFELLADTASEDAPPTSSAAPEKQVLNAETLQSYLRACFADETKLVVEEFYNVPGGRSKETTMILLSGTKNLPDKIVMRADIPGGLVPSKTVDEYAIVEIADRYGIPVPKPLHCETDASKLGNSFILVSAVSGSTQGEYFPDLGGCVEDKPEVGRQLARILAKIHQIPLSELADTHIDADVDLTELVLDTIETTYAQARDMDASSRIHIEMAYQWLKKNMHLAADEPCLIHCDVGLHNMLIDDGGDVSAMLDWELATLASPSREIAKIFHLIDYLMPREEFLAEYLAAGGPERAVDPERMNFYAIMNYMVTTQRSRFANQLFFSGQQRNIVMANAAYDSFYRCITLLSNALSAVYPDAAASALRFKKEIS